MSTTKAFRGFIPVRKKGSNNTSAGVDVLPSTSGGRCSNNLFTGDLVVMPGANLATIQPHIATTLKPSGVFAGCQYVEDGEQKFRRHWTGGTCVTDLKFHVITDPDQIYYIQASLSLSVGEINVVKNYAVTVSSTASSGDTTTGQSSYYLLAASGAETELAARVVKKAELPDEKDSDAFPIVEVWLNTHRDRYVTATASTA